MSQQLRRPIASQALTNQSTSVLFATLVVTRMNSRGWKRRQQPDCHTSTLRQRRATSTPTMSWRSGMVRLTFIASDCCRFMTFLRRQISRKSVMHFLPLTAQVQTQQKSEPAFPKFGGLEVRMNGPTVLVHYNSRFSEYTSSSVVFANVLRTRVKVTRRHHTSAIRQRRRTSTMSWRSGMVRFFVIHFSNIFLALLCLIRAHARRLSLCVVIARKSTYTAIATDSSIYGAAKSSNAK